MIPKSVRNLKQWWNHFPCSKKDKLIAFAPIIASLLFIFALFIDIAHLLSKESERDAINTMQALEILALQIKSDIQKNEDQLEHIAFSISKSKNPKETFIHNIEKFAAEQHPGIIAYYWQDNTVSYIYPPNDNLKVPLQIKEIQEKILEQRDPLTNTQSRLYYGKTPFADTPLGVMYSSTIANSNKENFGILSVAYNLNHLLQKQLTAKDNSALDIWFENDQGEILSKHFEQSTFAQKIEDQKNTLRFKVDIDASSIILAAKPRQAIFTNTIGKIFLSISICMGLIVAFLFLVNWQYVRLRIKVQKKAAREFNFRLAIEKSMIVGLKAIDCSGKIIYVNPAFCKMTAYSEQELIGSTSPYPYWPDSMQKSLSERFASDLSNTKVISNDFDIELQRRNGELFYARVCMSPLIDVHDRQNGWIITMTDITEMQQAREELTLAGKRFTTVLESLDTLISVVAVGNNELLFTNGSYQNCFGNKAQGHLVFTRNLQQKIDPRMMQYLANSKAAQPQKISETQGQNSKAGERRHDIYIDLVGRWFDIQERYLAWVDGRLAHMIFATDVTERHLAQEQSLKLHQRTQEVSRLITMGEMASSIAHELNQPLTAIHNYCNGLISRIKTDQLSQDNLIETLGKTSKQAIRAGQVIQRIRSYVQQSTPPQRTLIPAGSIMDNIRELAEIDTRRHNIKLNITIDRNLPDVYADPLLIEQVLLNLVRNAIDAIETANRPAEQRFIDIQIKRDVSKQACQYVEFSIVDSGTGVSPEVRKELFMPFFTTKKNGLGIGLNLCNSIIESHGGHIHIKNISKNDHLIGCCFSFSLPIEKSE